MELGLTEEEKAELEAQSDRAVPEGMTLPDYDPGSIAAHDFNEEMSQTTVTPGAKRKRRVLGGGTIHVQLGIGGRGRRRRGSK